MPARASLSSLLSSVVLRHSLLSLSSQCCAAAREGDRAGAETRRTRCRFSWEMVVISLQRALRSSALARTCISSRLMYSRYSSFSFANSSILVISKSPSASTHHHPHSTLHRRPAPLEYNRMNLLKSAFGGSKNETLQRSLQELYEEVKEWDCARARALGGQLQVVEVVMEALDGKVGQVDRYIASLERVMAARIDEITTYCRNGVNDSEFFLVPCPLASMKPSHQLLKHLLMEESQRELALSKRAAALSDVLERLRRLKAEECSGGEREGGTVSELKSSIRFLIDCQLPDLNAQVQASCREVSSALREGRDFYLAIEKFVRQAAKQLQMHLGIGSELLRLLEVFARREKHLRVQLRDILGSWVREDLEDRAIEEQLARNKTEELIDDYYDIENMAPQHAALWGGGSLAHFLTHFQVLPFALHDRLVLFSRLLLYNAKVEARLVLTQQRFAHLFRLNALVPDFTFSLGKQIRVRVVSALAVGVAQWKRTLMLREETEFEFTLEFNLEGDLREFLERARALGCQVDTP